MVFVTVVSVTVEFKSCTIYHPAGTVWMISKFEFGVDFSSYCAEKSVWHWLPQ